MLRIAIPLAALASVALIISMDAREHTGCPQFDCLDVPV
jgi:hypothetical protein